MAIGIDLQEMQQFNPYEEAATLSNRWTVWLTRIQRFVAAMYIKYASRKHCLLLYLAGPDVEIKRFLKLFRIMAKQRNMTLL